MKKIIIIMLGILALIAGAFILFLRVNESKLSVLQGNDTYTFSIPYKSDLYQIPLLVANEGNVNIKFGIKNLFGDTQLSITDDNGNVHFSKELKNGRIEFDQYFLPGNYEIAIQFHNTVPACSVFSLTPCTTDPADYLIPVSLSSNYMEISGDNKGFFWPYYLYIPEDIKPGQQCTILVVPNNSGFVSDSYQAHKEAAKSMIKYTTQYADALGCPLLVPAFPRWQSIGDVYTHALDRDTMLIQSGDLKRLDMQLLSMIEDARKILGERNLETDHRVMMLGFSASGMFTNRFTLLHPESMKAAAIGSPGGWPTVPVGEHHGIELPYPIGIHDIEEITGKGFSLDQYRSIPQFFYIGSVDTNDSVPFRDSYSSQHCEIITDLFGKTPVERWPLAEMIYKNAGCTAEFRMYHGVGHEINEEMEQDIIAFFQEALN